MPSLKAQHAAVCGSTAMLGQAQPWLNRFFLVGEKLELPGCVRGTVPDVRGVPEP